MTGRFVWSQPETAHYSYSGGVWRSIYSAWTTLRRSYSVRMITLKLLMSARSVHQRSLRALVRGNSQLAEKCEPIGLEPRGHRGMLFVNWGKQHACEIVRGASGLTSRCT
jgi:hypothetical protein